MKQGGQSSRIRLSVLKDNDVLPLPFLISIGIYCLNAFLFRTFSLLADSSFQVHFTFRKKTPYSGFEVCLAKSGIPRETRIILQVKT